MPIYQRLVNTLKLTVICLLLSACGFKPRCQNVLPPQLHYVFIDSSTPYGDFESILRHKLELLGVCVVRRPDIAPISLHIIDICLLNVTPTIGGSNVARVYHFYYKVTFDIQDICHHTLVPPQTLVTTENLVINAGEALESTHQLEILRQEMQQEIAHMMVNRLNSPQVCAWLLSSQ